MKVDGTGLYVTVRLAAAAVLPLRGCYPKILAFFIQIWLLDFFTNLKLGFFRCRLIIVVVHVNCSKRGKMAIIFILFSGGDTPHPGPLLVLSP